MDKSFKRVAGLRVPEPAPRAPHVRTLTTYKCSECAFFSPVRAAVERHIGRQHTPQEASDG